VEPPLQPLPKAQEEQQQQRFLSETHPQSDNHCDKGYDGVFLYESMCLCGYQQRCDKGAHGELLLLHGVHR